MLHLVADNTVRFQTDERTVKALTVGRTAFRELFPQSLVFERLGPFMGLKPRKIRSLFYGEDRVENLDSQRQRAVRRGLIEALRWYANYMRARADHWDAVADKHEAEELSSMETSLCSDAGGLRPTG